MSLSRKNRIAKNTLLLYIRMMFGMLVSLYTSRVVLNVLGVVDFGIYNVVGGVVMMFSFLNGAMASSTQRFFSFELGKNNTLKLGKLFSTSMFIHFLISIMIVVLAETIGLWFLKTKMTIPTERMEAAMWVYQFSVLTMVILITNVPFTALIISHEKMSAFAYISIAEVTLKLIVVFLLDLMNYDKLKLYAILIFLVTVLLRITYKIYCSRNFRESKARMAFDKPLFIEMSSFASWSLFGNVAFMGLTHGLNLLLNVFFNPAVNAARAISVQVQSAINGFSMNFQIAVNPQITKSYAKDDLLEMHSLIFSSSKISFYLLLLLSLPVILEAELVLKIWLNIVPEHTVNFVRIILVTTLFEALAYPLSIAAQSTGKIKKYQLFVGGLLLTVVPISYVALTITEKPEWAYFVHLLIVILTHVVRVVMMRKLIKMSIEQYFSNVISKVVKVSVLGTIIPISIFLSFDPGYLKLFVVVICSVLSVVVFSFLVGLNTNEKKFIEMKIKQLKKNI